MVNLAGSERTLVQIDPRGESGGKTPVLKVITGSHDDTVIVSAASEIFETGGGRNYVLGGGGDDYIYGGNDRDYLVGDSRYDGAYEGDDYIVGADGSDQLIGSGGNDILIAGGSADEKGNTKETGDMVAGGSGDDLIFGSRDRDILDGGVGRDIIHGNGGDDWLGGGSDRYFLPGDPDPNIFSGSSPLKAKSDAYTVNKYHVSAGGWSPQEVNEVDFLYAFSGWTAYVYTPHPHYPGKYTFAAYHSGWNGTEGHNNHQYKDPFTGQKLVYDDRALTDMEPGLCDDQLFGGAGNDSIYGMVGNDLLDGGSGNDIMFGDGGNDILYADFEYEENKTITINRRDDSNGWIRGGDDKRDMLYGGRGDDILVAGTGKDLLYGEEDNDTLYAGIADNAVLDGGTGNDTFVIGRGHSNTFKDEEGSDTYVIDINMIMSGMEGSSVQDTIIDKDGKWFLVINGVRLNSSNFNIEHYEENSW